MLKSLFNILLITFVSLFLLGCSDPKLTFIPKNEVILAFGDSLTYGVGVDEDNAYPSVLEQLSQRSVVNGGISGEVTEQGLARLPETLDEFRPHTLILIEGGNDILRNYNLTTTKQNLRAMIQLALSRNIQVVLVAVPAKNIFSNQASLYKELAEEFNLAYQDNIIGSLLRSPKYKSDPIHFNEAGYRKLAESIYTLIKENGGW